MYTFEVWVRLSSGATTTLRMQARDNITCRQLAEAQYGSGNVLGVTYINE